MCGRFTLIAWDEVEQRFLPAGSGMEIIRERFAETGPERYNIAPAQDVITITGDGEANAAQFMRWGLVPSWAKDVSIGSRMINARAETLAERPSFRVAFRRRRCLVVADSFYEWKRDGRKRTPMRISLESGELFGFAGLWESWKGPEGRRIQSCTIVTTEANEFLAPIHNRMPVILSRDAEPMWLDPDVQDTDALSELLASYPSDLMNAYEVSSVVNSAANDVPECIAPVVRLI
ncbi:MAG: SOS response-associated peptidase [Dehalococcoidia bacterium]|nr:SOS response-associated peptidase [Dehalococcoidia bacterium]